MKILQTQRSIPSAVEKGEVCKEQHFHVVVCLSQEEIPAFMQALHRLVAMEKGFSELIQGGSHE